MKVLLIDVALVEFRLIGVRVCATAGVELRLMGGGLGWVCCWLTGCGHDQDAWMGSYEGEVA